MAVPVSSTSTGEGTPASGVLTALFLATTSLLAPFYWKLLTTLQSLMIPKTTGGANGPWVIRPDFGIHIMGTVTLTFVTSFVLVAALSRWLRRPNAQKGTREDRFHGQPILKAALMLKAAILLIVYSSCVVLYVFSWTSIGRGGIEERRPWRTRHHSFREVEALESIPDGMRSDALKANGPWIRLKFRGGSVIDVSLENEGMTSEELTAIMTFVAARSGMPCVIRSDIHTYP